MKSVAKMCLLAVAEPPEGLGGESGRQIEHGVQQ